LSNDNIITDDDLLNSLNGNYFVSNGINNLIEEDFFSWVLSNKIQEKILTLSKGLAKELLRHNINEIDEDIFKEIYQTIVRQGERHRTGEYYTPEWLSNLTLRESINQWKVTN